MRCILRVLDPVAATCKDEVLASLSRAEPPPRLDALEREGTSECSADESEAMPHGPLGIYYNQ